MKPLYSLLLLITLALPCPLLAQEGKEEIEVVAEGIATLGTDPAGAEEEAIWEAKRNAVEQAAGLFIKAQAVGHDFQLSSDEIRTRSEGYIRQWERIPNTRKIETVGNGRLLRIKIRAKVALLPLLLHLEAIKEVWEDMERPRLFVQTPPTLETQRLHLRQFLEEQGFAIADSPASAAIVLRLTGVTSPLIKWRDTNAPYGVGGEIATQRASLTLELASIASEETLLTKSQQATGSSFHSDGEASSDACQEALQSLLDTESKRITQMLLLRWVHERQEGYIVALCIKNLPKKARESLRLMLENMRGFRAFISENSTTEGYTLRFSTRLAVRDIRRRLSEFRHSDFALLVRDESGAIIHCAAVRPRLRLPSRGEPKT